MSTQSYLYKTALAVAAGIVFQTAQTAYAADPANASDTRAPAAASLAQSAFPANGAGTSSMATAPSLTPAAAASAAPPPCVGYSQYTTRIEVATVPLPVCLRVAPELGGVRGAMAEHGFGFGLVSMLGYAYDLNGNNAPKQAYNGQDPTYNQTTNVYLTYDLSRIGFSQNAQFTLSGSWATSTYRSANPHVATMTIFGIDQPLFDRRIELIYGFIPGIRLFYGMTLGGNASTSALGPQSVVPFQAGMSASEPTPTFNVIMRSPSLRFYDSFAVTRSMSPEGILKDIDYNPSGFRLSVPGARALFINELGYKRAASPTESSMWLRLGTLYNTSSYTRFNSATPSSNNYEFYVAGTWQLTRPWHDARGLYVDSKFDWSPADRNALNRAVQVSAFYIGPFASRPFDMLAVGITKSLYSGVLRDVYASYHADPAAYTMAYTASYAARVIRGAYLISSLTYTKNPVFAPHHPDALLLQETLTFTF
ncbi:carbohydrate porin [Paraburkholderia unamae]|uniref:Porin n=1 Tax=Paraburkholderia unamae TaxID=219649 RepID=A0ABX5KL12_9BURK|nr:carbohydrate porin [Paraburkholderia unamae]PVX81704.1 porin [Paraburkholderia unamae]